MRMKKYKKEFKKKFKGVPYKCEDLELLKNICQVIGYVASHPSLPNAIFLNNNFLVFLTHFPMVSALEKNFFLFSRGRQGSEGVTLAELRKD